MVVGSGARTVDEREVHTNSRFGHGHQKLEQPCRKSGPYFPILLSPNNNPYIYNFGRACCRIIQI